MIMTPEQTLVARDPDFFFGGAEGKAIWEGTSGKKRKGLGKYIRAGRLEDAVRDFVDQVLAVLLLEDTPLNRLVLTRRFCQMKSCYRLNPVTKEITLAAVKN